MGLSGGILSPTRGREAVADAVLVEDIGGVGGGVAELVAELLDDGAHAIGVVRAPAPPHLSEERLRSDHASPVEREDAQQVELGGRERDFAAGHAHTASAVIDGELPVHERLGHGPVPERRLDARVALLLVTMRTPWRFRTKRNLWGYSGLAVVTSLSADYTLVEGRPVRRRRAPMTRGLNRNHNRVLKDVFKGAATAATARPGPLQDFYHEMIARGMRPELARVTLTRKLAAITLRLWKTGELYDPTKLTMQAR